MQYITTPVEGTSFSLQDEMDPPYNRFGEPVE
jgi:hypothetical protein